MARKPRLVVENGVYHVFSRGNNKERIFWDERDYRALLRLLERAAARFEIVVLSYCLMPNHLHLLVQVPKGNLSEALQFVVGGYSRATNKRRHLFQNRFGSVHVTSDAQLLGCFRYIALNPVEAGLCDDPEHYRWSSHRALAGLAFPPPFLAAREALAHFGRTPELARNGYRAFVRDTSVTVSDTVTGM
jgi:REP element-mobilizing transposase RayT